MSKKNYRSTNILKITSNIPAKEKMIYKTVPDKKSFFLTCYPKQKVIWASNLSLAGQIQPTTWFLRLRSHTTMFFTRRLLPKQFHGKDILPEHTMYCYSRAKAPSALPL